MNRKHKLYGSYVKRLPAENKKKYVDYKIVLVNTLRIAQAKLLQWFVPQC